MAEQGSYHPPTAVRAQALARRRPVRRQRGFSLVELMVAVLLGLFMAAGIINIYLESKRNYSYEDEQARLQENGRFALHFLKSELQHVGFYGGIPGGENLPSAGAVGSDCVSAGNWALAAAVPLEIIDNFSAAPLTTVSGTTWSCLVAGQLQPGADIFSVKRSAGDYTLRNGNYNTNMTAAELTQWYVKKTGVDPVTAEFTYLGASGIPVAEAVSGSTVEYWEYFAKILYVRKYSRAVGDGIPALCVEQLQANSMVTDCLVEGVEDMQIEWGIDADGDGTPTQFKAAPALADMDDIAAARVYLLMRSVNGVPNYTNTKTYSLGAKAVAAKNDGFLRTVLATTVQIRNLAYAR